MTEVEAVENDSLEYCVCHGVVTNTGVIINEGKVVGKQGGVFELFQGVLKGCEGVLIAAVI